MNTHLLDEDNRLLQGITTVVAPRRIIAVAARYGGALAMLTSLPARLKKFVLTNCAEKQAVEALEVLGLRGQFDGVYGADAMGDVCKPEETAFRKIIAASGIEPTRTAFFEDSVKNLAAAKTLGMTTAGTGHDLRLTPWPWSH